MKLSKRSHLDVIPAHCSFQPKTLLSPDTILQYMLKHVPHPVTFDKEPPLCLTDEKPAILDC